MLGYIGTYFRLWLALFLLQIVIEFVVRKDKDACVLDLLRFCIANNKCKVLFRGY